MRVLLSEYGAREGVEPVGGLAGRRQALGAQGRVCAPDCAAGERGDALVATGLVPAGAWR